MLIRRSLRVCWREIRINFYDNFKDVHKNLRENLFNGIVLSRGIRL